MKKTYLSYTYGLAKNPSAGRPLITFETADEARSYLHKMRRDELEDRRKYGGNCKLYDWAIIEQKTEQTFDDSGYFLDEIITRKTIAIELQA